LFLGSLFTPVAYHDPLLFAELLGHYPIPSFVKIHCLSNTGKHPW